MSINGFNVSGVVHKYNYPALDNIAITRADISDSAFCDFAGVYSSSKTYAVGDYTFYNQVLYRCIVAITTPEVWTAAHWKRVDVCDDVKQLSDVVNHAETPKGSVNLFDYARDVFDGKYVSYTTGAISTLSSYGCYYMVPVKPGQNLFVTSWLNYAHIAFYDCFGVFISGIARNPYTDAHAGLITIPSNAYFMSFSYAKPAQDESGGKVVCVPAEYYSNGETEYDLPYTGKHLFDAAKKCNRNLIDNNLGFINAYYHYQTGNLATVSNYNAIEIPAMAETTYHINDTSAHVAFMNDAGTYISGVTGVTSFTTPAGCGYIRLGFRRIIGGETATPYLIADDSGNCVYSPFGVGDVYTVDKTSTVLTVGVGQKYQTIASAISDASDGDTILIYPGTYTESLNAYGKEIHIRGISKAGCILTYSANNYYLPPLHMAKGTCENLTIKATWSGDTTNDRAYCVHIDSDNEVNKTLTFSNVEFISERGATVGIGLRSGFKLSFKNCTFRTTDTAVEGPIYLHDSEVSPYTDQSIEFINCLIINESSSWTIKMQSQEHLDKCCKVTYLNNKVVQPNNNGVTVTMVMYGGRTLTNTNYLGSSDFVLTNISAFNSDSILDY